MTDGYQQIVHREVEISAAGGLRIEKKDGLEETAGNEKIKITKEDTGFQNGKIRIQAIDGGEITVSSIRRGYGNPSYAGTLDLYATSEGVVMVNELPLENYLCKVVPSVDARIISEGSIKGPGDMRKKLCIPADYGLCISGISGSCE